MNPGRIWSFLRGKKRHIGGFFLFLGWLLDLIAGNYFPEAPPALLSQSAKFFSELGVGIYTIGWMDAVARNKKVDRTPAEEK